MAVVASVMVGFVEHGVVPYVGTMSSTVGGGGETDWQESSSEPPQKREIGGDQSGMRTCILETV